MTKPHDIFRLINNAVLDLQSADSQSFVRFIRQLARHLNHPCLQEPYRNLTEHADLDAFLERNKNAGPFLSATPFSWPDDPLEQMGITLKLIEKMSEEESFANNLGFQLGAGTKVIYGLRAIVSQIIVPFARDFKEYVQSRGTTEAAIVVEKSNRIFLVHGHDEALLQKVARFVERVGLTPVILHEQANSGRTVIEKVEEFGDVGYAIVLLTPDDLGRAKDQAELEPRARQNVLFELGYFVARLGRRHTCALKGPGVELPSDLAGIVWTAVDQGDTWKITLFKELKAAGYNVDANAAFAH